MNRYFAAKAYLEATKYIHESPHRNAEPARITLTVLPMHMLIGFSIELFLKAWLLQAQIPSRTVRNYGHDLRSLFTDAQASGLPSIYRLGELIELFAGPHEDFTFRYIEAGDTVQMANWQLAFPVLDQLDIAVDQFVGASASRGLSRVTSGAGPVDLAPHKPEKPKPEPS